MHRQCLLQDSRPCCTIAYTENDLIVILVLFLISFFPLSEGNKTKPCSPPLGYTESLPNPWLLQHCKISLQNFVCTSFLFVFLILVWRFTSLGLFSLKISFKTISTLPSEMFLMWKCCQQTARAEHLFSAVRKHV